MSQAAGQLLNHCFSAARYFRRPPGRQANYSNSCSCNMWCWYDPNLNNRYCPALRALTIAKLLACLNRSMIS